MKPLAGPLECYGGKVNQRRQILKDLCPCRNAQVKDVEVWRGIAHIALNGSRRERNGASHAIGTLLMKARGSESWKRIVQEIQVEIDELMRDTRASRSLLGTMKKHGHATRGLARKNYRKISKELNAVGPSDLATWLNKKLALQPIDRINPSHPGIQRLSIWLKRRTEFEPGKRVIEDEILSQARRFMPLVFTNSTSSEL